MSFNNESVKINKNDFNVLWKVILAIKNTNHNSDKSISLKTRTFGKEVFTNCFWCIQEFIHIFYLVTIERRKILIIYSNQMFSH